jgi:hypothetical protein
MSAGLTQVVQVSEMERIKLYRGEFSFESPQARFHFAFEEPTDEKLCVAVLREICGIEFES